MSYTVKQVSELSGVSIRTLRWYDAIGLLKPAYTGENQYRYYEEPELLLLQQILFYKELGFALSDIQVLLLSEDFEIAVSLSKQRQALSARLDNTHQLIKTLDKTLEHINKRQVMNEKELYQGFRSWEGRNNPKVSAIIQAPPQGENEEAPEWIVLNSVRNPHQNADWDPKAWTHLQQEATKLYEQIMECMNQGLAPKEDKVQALIAEHCKMQDKFLVINRTVYLALGALYSSNASFRQQLDAIHPTLHDYMHRAIGIYGFNNLN